MEEIMELKLKNSNLKHDLKRKNTEYLRITKSLHIRSLCEEFEKSIQILCSKELTREAKWAKLLSSSDMKCVEFRKCLEKRKLNVDDVPKIARGLFDKVNSDVHSDFRQSHEDLQIMKSYFTPNEYTLIKCIVEFYGLDKVVYIENNNPEED